MRVLLYHPESESYFEEDSEEIDPAINLYCVDVTGEKQHEENFKIEQKKAFNLREYQIDALTTIDNDFNYSSEPVLLQAIMGAGKTVISVRLINRYFKEHPERYFLILAHKKELVEQFHKTFLEKSDISEFDIGICCSGLNRREIDKRVTIGTIQTFINCIDEYKNANLLIIDEAHRISIGTGSQYDIIINKLREKNSNLRILGITATPFRLGSGYIYGDKNIGDVLFQKLNYKIEYEVLRDQGFLMPLEAKVAVNNSLAADLETVELSEGDYAIGQASSVMTKGIHLQTAKEAIYEYCQDFKHICIFCCTIEHAEQLADLIGNECTLVHSQLSSMERYQNMQAWISGKKRIMVSINILIEGFDFPELDCLIMARPTLSPALYLQAVGRVLRIHPNKEKAFLLDLTTNTLNFGYNLDNIKVKIPKSAIERLEKEHPFEKLCPDCLEWLHIARFDCPHCSYTFSLPESKQEAASLPDLKEIEFNEPVEHYITKVDFTRHQKEGKPDSVKITYYNSNPYRSRVISEWCCVEHTGKARNFAVDWWHKNTTSVAVPETVEEALELLPRFFIQPEVITVKKVGDFDRIIKKEYDDIPF